MQVLLIEIQYWNLCLYKIIVNYSVMDRTIVDALNMSITHSSSIHFSDDVESELHLYIPAMYIVHI